MSKKTVKTIIGIIAFGVILSAVVFNINHVASALAKVGSIFAPLFIGAALAFILNVPMKFVEKRILKKVKRPKWKRACSILITLAFCAVIIMIVAFSIVPEIVRTVQSIVNDLPGMSKQVQDVIHTVSAYSERLDQLLENTQIRTSEIIDQAIQWVQDSVSKAGGSVFTLVTDTVGKIVNFAIGFVFSIYILAMKEKLVRQLRMILNAFLKESVARKIWDVVLMANHTFQRFISGQCLEACILGCMFLLAMTIFRMPYAVLISVVIGVLALIPIFGAFVGCLVGFILILFVDPWQAVGFLILFIVLQQIEGHCIYPFVIGNSVGLPSIWVLLAVVVGGKLFGVAGMLVFIPLCSVLYALFSMNVKKRLKQKNITIQGS